MISITPDHFRKLGSMIPSPAPFLTPRPERHRRDSKGFDWNSNRQEKDREVNVQVLLRCRPLNDDEQRSNVPKVISCNEHKREVTVLQNIANKQLDRAFTFDKVFGPKSQQRSIYDQAISPIVSEVLEGFNCTVFAYGQTGTGKTYTMEGGGMRSKGGELPVEAGVIPRAVRQIFDTLEAQKADYNMKVTFVELYNEEIIDLLAQEEYSRSLEDRQKKTISLMEDGKGCVIVRGLEEETVYSANDIFNLLERGAAKRRTADTLLNKRSSRSHSIFSISVHVKEAAMGDDELIKCGKLNLVDLAGSENLSRSGAREGRGREAGEINKSLLTLGRVINALVEHSGHIPYRDSKLTRLLRDSLGGKTKTCIIATVSPSSHCLEETLSTLDYAYRAKNIKNKPEANQKMSKAVLLKDIYLELQRMKQDVQAAREKNGVYIPNERFAQDEAEKKARNEKLERLEINLDLSKQQVEKFHQLYQMEQEKNLNLENERDDCKVNLENSSKALQDLQENYRVALSELKEKEVIITKLQNSENSLIEHAKEMRYGLQNAAEDITAMCTKIEDKNKIEAENHKLVLAFNSHLSRGLNDLHNSILGSHSQQQQQLRCMEEHLSSFLSSKCNANRVLESKIEKMRKTFNLGVRNLKELANTMQMKASTDLKQINSTISSKTMAVEKFFEAAVLEAKEVICQIQSSLSDQKQMLAFSAQQYEEELQRNLLSAQITSEATRNFFNEIQHGAHKFMTILEESHIKKSQQLSTFEKIFKDEAAKEEKLAMEKIAAILATLTNKKTAMVSKASRNISGLSGEENERLKQEMSSMRQISASGSKEMCKYIEILKQNFVQSTFSLAENRATMETLLQDCGNWLDYSKQQWENGHLSVQQLNNDSLLELESTVKEKISQNDAGHEEFITVSSSINAECDAEAREFLAAANESLMLDLESKKEMDSMCTKCFELLNTVEEKHSKDISNIRNQAEQSLANDYLVDDQTIPTHKKREVAIPGLELESIKEMTPPASESLVAKISENKFKWSIDTESKSQQQSELIMLSPSRIPFADVN